MHLIDINLWLALTFEAHAHHQPAVEWFNRAQPGSCVFCRLTQQGFLRLATNAAIFGDEALTMKRAWTCYDKLMKDKRVEFREDSERIEKEWRNLTQQNQRSHRIWSDAYLAAFALTSNLTIATFDKGFKAYPRLKVDLLEN